MFHRFKTRLVSHLLHFAARFSFSISSAETTPAPEETPKEEHAPETTEKKEETTEDAPKKSVFSMMCGCFSGKKTTVEDKVDETKKDETVEKEEEKEAAKPEGENVEASA
jgi:hypothetical protein